MKETIQVKIPYDPHKNQKVVHNDPHRFRVLVCGRRWGKTTLAICELIKASIVPKSINWLIAPTYKQAKMIAWRKLFEYLPEDLIEKKNEVELSVTLMNGSLIELKGAEKEDSLRGVKLNFVIFDESADIKPNVLPEIIRAALADVRGKALFIGTPKGMNWYYDLFQKEKEDKDYKSFRFTSYDNPYIPDDEIDKAKLELNEDYFAQEFLADFRKFTGLIYKDFNRSIHLVDPFNIPSSWTRYRSIDYGFTNPFACLWAAIDNDDNIYIYDEYYQTEKTVAENVKAIQEKTGNQVISKTFIDPSVEQRNGQTGLSIRQQIERQGMFVTLANNEVLSGINEVITKLKVNPETGKPKLFILRHCFNLIAELESYQWAETKEGQNDKQQPRKFQDHACDSLRYIISSLSKAKIPTSGIRIIQESNKKYNKTQTVFDMKF